MSIFKYKIEENQSNVDNDFINLSLYINFYYDKIVSDQKMMDFLVNSERILNKFHSIYSDYTRQQIESIFISFNIIMVLLINDKYSNSNIDTFIDDTFIDDTFIDDLD